jgi:hypothetical protein
MQVRFYFPDFLLIAEHVSAVTSAMKNKMELALGVAIGSSNQIALMVVPVTVLMGWAMDQPMTLHFSVFETAVLFVSVFVVNLIITDGKSNYLEGAMLLAQYTVRDRSLTLDCCSGILDFTVAQTENIDYHFFRNISNIYFLAIFF